MRVEDVERTRVANVVDGTNAPGESDEGEGGVDVEGELCSISACSCEQSNKAVNTSDLVEHLMTRQGLVVEGRKRLG